MSSIATLNGQQYIVPAYNDTGWAQGAGNLSLYLAAIASSTLQPTGGAFTLTADVDFGANFGLKALFLKTETANPASAGVIRLASADTIKWRNNANGADVSLSKDSSDNLLWATNKVYTAGGAAGIVNADIAAGAAIAYSKLALTGAILNADLAGSIAYSKLVLTGAILNADLAGSIAYSKLTLTGAILNADINASAAIALSKLAALGTAKAVQTNASTGLLEASSVTNTELGYLSGVTSAIQTQINAIAPTPANILINGGFEYWQRNTTFSSPVTYTADRWTVQKNGTPTYTISKETTTIDSGLASLKLDITGATGSPTYLLVYQPIENVAELRGKVLTVSIRLKSNAAVRVFIYDGTEVGSATPHTGGNAWETISATKTVGAAAASLWIGFGFDNTTVGVIPAISTTYADGAMAVVGSAVPTYYPSDPQVELARCQRYYEKSYDLAVVPGTANANGSNFYCGFQFGATSVETTFIAFKVSKRTTPTVTLYRDNASNTTGQWRWSNTSGVATARTTGLDSIYINGFEATETAALELNAIGQWVADAEM